MSGWTFIQCDKSAISFKVVACMAYCVSGDIDNKTGIAIGKTFDSSLKNCIATMQNYYHELWNRWSNCVH